MALITSVISEDMLNTFDEDLSLHWYLFLSVQLTYVIGNAGVVINRKKFRKC